MVELVNSVYGPKNLVVGLTETSRFSAYKCVSRPKKFHIKYISTCFDYSPVVKFD